METTSQELLHLSTDNLTISLWLGENNHDTLSYTNIKVGCYYPIVS